MITRFTDLCADMVKLDLTGGTETGYKVGEAAGRLAKRYTAELGGNAAVMVFADCPNGIDAAVNGGESTCSSLIWL